MSGDLRQRYRAYMARLDPVGDPNRAIADGLYVDSPHSTHQRIGRRLELDYSSAHVLLGGVGSGKTTELRLIERQLSEVPDVEVLFLDIGEFHDRGDFREGVLLAAAGAVLAKTVLDADAPEAKAATSLRNLASGYWEDDYYDSDDYYSDGPPRRYVPGVLKPPARATEAQQAEAALRHFISTAQRRVVLLIDGLDRVRSSDAFLSALVADISALRRSRIGAVVVASHELRFSSAHLELSEIGIEVQMHGAADVKSPAGHAFLHRVLERRIPPDMMADDARERLVQASGGVLRDLISIARAAGQDSYGLGHDWVPVESVDRAADAFGRQLLLGIDQAMADRLGQLRPQYGPRTRLEFTLATRVDVDLLLRRILVEVSGDVVRYHVHPCVEPLLDGLRKSA